MRTLLIATGAGILLGTGCAQTPEMGFSPTAPVVEWNDLLQTPAGDVRNTYRLFPTERTKGVFPTSLAVARLAAVVDGSPNGHRLSLAMKPEVDFLTWNSVFDDFRSISEVFPLNDMALDGAPVSVATLLDAARDLDAGMLLLYTEIQKSLNECEFRGVLYEVADGRPLAQLQADAYVDVPVARDDRKRYNESYDEDNDRDPRLVGLGGFESTSRDCLLALMDNDDPGARLSPEGWIPDRPIEDLIWPPSEDLLLRRHRD